MESPAARVRRYWSELGVRLAPVASEAEVEAFELRYGVRLPADVREFVQVAGGMVPFEWDEELISWYPLDRWRPLAEVAPEVPFPAGEGWFVFADYSIEGFLYVLPFGSAAFGVRAIAMMPGGERPSGRVAESLGALLEAYLAKPASLLDW